MSDSINLPLQKLASCSQLPSYAHEGDAGLDLRSTETVTLKPFERAAIACGIAIAIPAGYAGLVVPRSGLAAKQGLSVVNAPGLIDSNYRGEIKVICINLDAHDPIEITPGDRIAQLVITAVPNVSILPVEELDQTNRGADGFGSSGVQ